MPETQVIIRRGLAILCGIVSMLFGGLIAMFIAIDTPGEAPTEGLICVGVAALVSLVPGCVLWGSSRLLLFLSLYCFGLASMMVVYVAIITAPILNPALAAMLSPENRQIAESAEIQWIPPLALIVVTINVGICLFVYDRSSRRSGPDES